MKAIAYAFFAAVLCTPIIGSSQSSALQPNAVRIELAKENKFVVKILNVYNKSGDKIPGIRDLKSYNSTDRLFTFKSVNGKHKKISAEKIQKIQES